MDHTMVGITEFRNKISEFIRRAEAGETILILKHNRPVAALIGFNRLQRLTSSV